MAVTSQTPDQIAANWAARLGQSTDKITAGVDAVKVPPGQAAARNKTGYVNGVNASADKWARNVAAVGLADWQDAMKTKGAPRIATGAQAAQSKFAGFMAKLLPFQQNLVNSLPARGGLDANINRAVAFMRGMSQFSK